MHVIFFLRPWHIFSTKVQKEEEEKKDRTGRTKKRRKEKRTLACRVPRKSRRTHAPTQRRLTPNNRSTGAPNSPRRIKEKEEEEADRRDQKKKTGGKGGKKKEKKKKKKRHLQDTNQYTSAGAFATFATVAVHYRSQCCLCRPAK